MKVQLGFSQLVHRLKDQPPPSGLDSLYKWERNLALQMAFLAKATPWQVARDWKHLLPRHYVPQPPTRQSPHWWQRQAVSLRGLTGKGKIGGWLCWLQTKTHQGEVPIWRLYSGLCTCLERVDPHAFWVIFEKSGIWDTSPMCKAVAILVLLWGAFHSHPAYSTALSLHLPLWTLFC